MKRIALITLAGLAILATAATAHQNNSHVRGNGRIQLTEYTDGGCPINTNMMGWGMMRQEIGGNATPGVQTNNWRTNPSYQGQVDDTTTTGK